MKKHTVSFKNALAGVEWVLRTQPNFKIHIALSLLSIVGGWFLHISHEEFIIILILIFAGLPIEMLNTAIEVATDAIDTSWREDIKVAKDVAAAAMLVYATGAFIIACIIFIPKIIGLL